MKRTLIAVAIVAFIFAAGCAADVLGPFRVAANTEYDAIAAESASVEMSVRLAAYKGIAACGDPGPSTPACRDAAVASALAAGSAAIARVNHEAALQRNVAQALDMADLCKAQASTCYDDATATVKALLAELQDGGVP